MSDGGFEPGSTGLTEGGLRYVVDGKSYRRGPDGSLLDFYTSKSSPALARQEAEQIAERRKREEWDRRVQAEADARLDQEQTHDRFERDVKRAMEARRFAG